MLHNAAGWSAASHAKDLAFMNNLFTFLFHNLLFLGALILIVYGITWALKRPPDPRNDPPDPKNDWSNEDEMNRWL
jgi:hypothetical protein